MPEIRKAQAEMARNAGIEGFMYWHYWFGNSRRILERPFNEVLQSEKPDFPFCLEWANHFWTNQLWNSSSHWQKEKLYHSANIYKENIIINIFNILPVAR